MMDVIVEDRSTEHQHEILTAQRFHDAAAHAREGPRKQPVIFGKSATAAQRARPDGGVERLGQAYDIRRRVVAVRSRADDQGRRAARVQRRAHLVEHDPVGDRIRDDAPHRDR